MGALGAAVSGVQVDDQRGACGPQHQGEVLWHPVGVARVADDVHTVCVPFNPIPAPSLVAALANRQRLPEQCGRRALSPWVTSQFNQHLNAQANPRRDDLPEEPGGTSHDLRTVAPPGWRRGVACAIPNRVTAALQNGEMADACSSPMLPLRWTESSASCTDPEDEDLSDLDGGAAPDLDGGGAPDPEDSTRPADGDVPHPSVVVRTSSRRRKTAVAFWENGQIVVVLPAHVPQADRPGLVDRLVARVLAKRPRATTSDDALSARAALLADRYVRGVRPTSIRWVTNQGKRWASCSPQTGEIRISHRLRTVPGWVLDATIVHELAHLLHADHSTDFHAVANRYPRQHDAHVFLEGYSLGLHTAS